jgi:DNA-binding transcriptional LysR family regulator
MALRFEIEPRNREHAFALGSISYALYAPKNSDQGNLPWIAFGEDVAHSLPAQWIESARGKDGKVALRAHDTGFVHQAIRTGVGKGLIPEILGENDPGLVRLSGRVSEFERILSVLVHQDTYKIARTRTVIDWLRGLPWVNNT